GDDDATLRAHVMTDRPLYRPGEVVRGRVLLRQPATSDVRALAGARDTAWRTAPAAGRMVRILLFPHTDRELSVAATADGDGVAAFEFPLAAGVPKGDARLLVLTPRGADETGPHAHLTLADVHPFVVEEFRRPPLDLAVAGPERWTPGDPHPRWTVTAALPGGAPAVGLSGRLVASWGGFEDSAPFRLDAEGRAEATVRSEEFAEHLGGRNADAVSWRVELVAPDGQMIVRSGVVDLVEPPAAPNPPRDAASRDLTLDAPARGRAGAPLEIFLRGAPGAVVLAAAGGRAPFASAVVALDASGVGAVVLDVPPWAWPSCRVVAFQVEPWSERGQNVALERPEGDLRVRCPQGGAAFAPGAEAELAFEVADAHGAPRTAVLTVAVVDEAVFLMEEDRTPDPRAALTPDRVLAWPSRSDAPKAVDQDVFDGMLRDGRVTEDSSVGGGGGGAGGGGGRELRRGPRSDFRATAFFAAAVRADASGRAVVRFRWPDDLATWRVTVVAVDDGGSATSAAFRVRTELPLSATFTPPPALRAGDSVDVALAVRGDAGGRATVAASVEGPVTAETAGGGAVDLDAHGGGAAALTVSAVAAGDAAIEVRVVDAEGREDAERRAVRVLPRTIERRSARTVLMRRDGVVTLDAPPLDAEGGEGSLELEVTAGRDAAVRAVSAALEEYAFGCAEQTLSALTPVVAAARARRLRAGGDGAARLDEAAARRVEAGLARLRALRREDGYAWWYGADADFAMTPPILHLLAAAKEAGIDVHAAGAAPDVREGFPALALRALRKGGGDPENALKSDVFRGEGDATFDNRRAAERFRAAVPEERRASLLLETVAALVRHAPDDREGVEALKEFAARGVVAPSATLVRVGLALAAAGDVAAAAELLARAREGRGASGVSALAAESDAVHAAERLELEVALGRPATERAASIAQLMATYADRAFETTRGSGLALLALARDAAADGAAVDLGAHDAPPRTLRFDAGSTAVEVVVDPRAPERARVSVPPGTRSVAWVAPDDAEILVTLRRRVALDGATAPAEAAPIRLTRSLRRIEGDGTALGDPAENGAPPDAAVGDLLEAELTAASSEPVHYVLASCPLPAGVAFVRGSCAGADVYDERVDVCFGTLQAGATATVRFRVRVAARAEAVWPPAAAEASYRPDRRGATAGAVVRFGAARAASEAGPSAVEVLTPEMRAAEVERRVKAVLERRRDPAVVLDAVTRLAALASADARRACGDRVAPALLTETSAIPCPEAAAAALRHGRDAAARALLEGRLPGPSRITLRIGPFGLLHEEGLEDLVDALLDVAARAGYADPQVAAPRTEFDKELALLLRLRDEVFA
ncbi:MAG TPA: alpha-2-macroglobulin family protein, partial [Planctomycetota bacterium]|nr:alpha-2-macroglobulin family protein [Planctomycetota bacterium]